MTLLEPVVAALPLPAPIKVLDAPVTLPPALEPKAVLLPPVLFEYKAA